MTGKQYKNRATAFEFERKLRNWGGNLAIALPKDAQNTMDLKEGQEYKMIIDAELSQIRIEFKNEQSLTAEHERAMILNRIQEKERWNVRELYTCLHAEDVSAKPLFDKTLDLLENTGVLEIIPTLQGDVILRL